MSLNEVRTFVDYATAALNQTWNLGAMQPLSGLHPSSAILGPRETLLRSDVHTLWFRWFLDSIADHRRFLSGNTGYAHLVAEVFPQITGMFPNIPMDERRQLASTITRAISLEIERRRNRRRNTLSRESRLAIWDQAGPDQRCWICGYRFDAFARTEFLGIPQDEGERPLALFVDLAKPRGMSVRDYKVELDHVDPVALGGQDGNNLRLACGWCNAHKSDSVSLYDVAAESRTIVHPRIGRMAVPQPFWVIRILGLRQRCEWPGGCSNTTKDSELTIALRNAKGSMNPINMMAVCSVHDAMQAERLVSRNLFLKQ